MLKREGIRSSHNAFLDTVTFIKQIEGRRFGPEKTNITVKGIVDQVGQINFGGQTTEKERPRDKDIDRDRQREIDKQSHRLGKNRNPVMWPQEIC